MRITEPMTLATDYLLGGFAIMLAVRLLRDPVAGSQLSARFWAAAFVMTALAAFVGGSVHGFVHLMPEALGRGLWKATLVATGLASAAILMAAVVASAAGSLRTVLLGVVLVKLLVFVAIVARRDQFLLVIADSGSALVAVLLAAWLLRPTGLTPAAGWMAGAVAVSVAAGVIQAAKIAPHPQFNHNDLFHVVQMAALYLLFRGGLLMTDME
jgi:hypothetical protein